MKLFNELDRYLVDLTLKAHRSRWTSALVIGAALACAGAGALVLRIVQWIGG
jgi:hypothetical protein